MILFITRKYPPSVGGMQSINHRLMTSVSAVAEGTIISWGGAQRYLPLFLPYAFVKACGLLLSRRVTLVHLGDGLLAPFGLLLKRLFRVPVTVTVMGRDVTFAFAPYQWVVPRALGRLDRVVCLSDYLRQECMARGVPASRLVVIPSGVDVEAFVPAEREERRQRLAEAIGQPLGGRPLLFTAGRLVAKKGIHYFVEEVMPALVQRRPDLLYLVAGDGVLRGRITAAVQRNHLEAHVRLLGAVPMGGELLTLLYQAADLFVMPNVPTPGDAEGFGVVALEAAASGTWTVGADTDGVRESVAAEQTGTLLPPRQTEQFVAAICDLLADQGELRERGRKAAAFVRQHRTWPRIAEQYVTLFAQVAGPGSIARKRPQTSLVGDA